MVATVLVDKALRINSEDLKLHCRKYLPVYAVPSDILILKSFPRTSSGKVDREEIEKIIKSI